MDVASVFINVHVRLSVVSITNIDVNVVRVLKSVIVAPTLAFVYVSDADIIVLFGIFAAFDFDADTLSWSKSTSHRRHSPCRHRRVDRSRRRQHRPSTSTLSRLRRAVVDFGVDVAHINIVVNVKHNAETKQAKGRG